MGVIANGTSVKIEPIGNEATTSSQISVDNYNPDLSFQASALSLFSIHGNHSFSVTISGNPGGTISAICADIVLFTIFNDEFKINNLGFLNFKSAPYLASTTSSPTPCQLPLEILHLIKSSHVIIKKYILNDEIHTATNNNLLCDEKKQTEVSASISQGLNIDEYISYISSLSSASEIMKYTEKINEANNFIPPEILKIITSNSKLERMYGNAKDSCMDEIKEYFSLETS